MARVIRGGGLLVILSVFAIFVFIVSQILPLFRAARVELVSSSDLGSKQHALVLGVDEWGERPFVLYDDGEIVFFDVKSWKRVLSQNVFPEKIVATSYQQKLQKIFVLLQSGRYAWIKLDYQRVYQKGANDIQVSLKQEYEGQLFADGVTIEFAPEQTHVAFAVTATDAVAVIQSSNRFFEILSFESKKNMMGQVKVNLLAKQSLPDLLAQPVDHLALSHDGKKLLVINDLGKAYYLKKTAKEFRIEQDFFPFSQDKRLRVAAAAFLIGDMSIAFVNTQGNNHVYSLSRSGNSEQVLFRHTKTFPDLAGESFVLATNLRNKSFVLASDRAISLRYSTTESVRWQQATKDSIQFATINEKNNMMFVMSQDGSLSRFSLEDPHPDVSLKSYFGKVWYEGYEQPEYVWQSTGGTDEVEPKLSLVPLIFGTLKGTLYAMLFSVPVALLAAIYTSQFLHYRVKRIVKPLMEIMASFPSVILGFLAALWLAPLVETQIPAILLILFLVPALSFLCGSIFDYLRRADIYWLSPGREFLVVMPFILLVILFAFWFGPIVESRLFLVSDPASGQMLADFRLWFREVFSMSFEQRNSLIVGFMMGFAIIPIIFTVAEDALSNVPESLKSASLALGASRWQTALLVVVPSASSGLFSALIIGLGRAIGETMIVLMATGNTPIMEWNIFNGMRTLSANIAVELPEAPLHSSLYRSLFFGAFLLFVLTFVLNTVADVLRMRLREKYKTV